MPESAEYERNQARILRCVLFRRTTMDVLCDSLRLQCHEVRHALDGLEDAGHVRALGSSGMASLTVELTTRGRTRALQDVDERERPLAERGLAPDDVAHLRLLAGETTPDERSGFEWGIGATRLRLWEDGLVDVVGFLRPRAVLTEHGRSVLRTIPGGV